MFVPLENTKYFPGSDTVFIFKLPRHGGPGFLYFPDDLIVENHQEDGGDDLHDELGEDSVDYPGVAAHNVLLHLGLVSAVFPQEAEGSPALTLAAEQGDVVHVVHPHTAVHDVLLEEPRDLQHEGADESEGDGPAWRGVPRPGGVDDGAVPVDAQEEDDEARGGDEHVPQRDVDVGEVEFHLKLDEGLAVEKKHLQYVT